jgi:hypothetical protein
MVVIVIVVVVVIDLEGLLMVERGDAGDVSCRDRHRSRDSRQTEKKNNFGFILIYTTSLPIYSTVKAAECGHG